MPVTATVLMVCACIIIFVLLGIAVVLTVDIYRRVDTLEMANKKLNEITKTVASLNKLKLELEEEVFKTKLMRETKEERKYEHRILDNSNNINTIHSSGNTSNSNNDNSNTNDSSACDRENN